MRLAVYLNNSLYMLPLLLNFLMIMAIFCAFEDRLTGNLRKIIAGKAYDACGRGSKPLDFPSKKEKNDINGKSVFGMCEGRAGMRNAENDRRHVTFSQHEFIPTTFIFSGLCGILQRL